MTTPKGEREEALEAARKRRGKPTYEELVVALRECVSALDILMGDSDLDDDDSPEFAACQKGSQLLQRIEQ